MNSKLHTELAKLEKILSTKYDNTVLAHDKSPDLVLKKKLHDISTNLRCLEYIKKELIDIENFINTH